MPSIIRDQVVDQIVATLATITKANGYAHDLEASRIFRRRIEPGSIDTPAVVVRQQPARVDVHAGADRYEETLGIEIGFVLESSDDSDPDGKALALMADIQRALGPLAITFVLTVTLTSGGTDTMTVDLIETGNDVNLGDPIPNLILGSVSYSARYDRSWADPRKH